MRRRLREEKEVKKRSFTRDEGGPFGIGFQEQVSNHLKQLLSRVMVVSIEEKLRKKKLSRYGLERRITLNHC